MSNDNLLCFFIGTVIGNVCYGIFLKDKVKKLANKIRLNKEK